MLVLVSTFGYSQDKKELTLEDAVLKQRSSLAPKSLKGLKSIPGEDAISYQSDDLQKLYKQSVKGSSATEIISLASLNEILKTDLKHFYSLKWLNNESFLINEGNKYFEFNVNDKKGKLIAELEEGAENIDVHLNTKKIAYTNGKSLFLHGLNNSFPLNKRVHEEMVSGQAIARYEFGISKGTFWSKNANYIAFYEKDETNVSNYPLLDITTTPGNLNNIKYPMAGQSSELAKVAVFNLNTSKTYYLDTKGEKDQYLTNVSWSPDEKFVLVAVVNRDQNHMKLNKYDASNGKFIKTLIEEKNDRWVEPENPAYFISNTEFLWMSERDGFMNMYKYDIEGKLIKQITSNNWVATRIIGLDIKKSSVVFEGTGPNPTELHAYKVSLSSGKQTLITKLSGYHKVTMTQNYLVDNFSNISTPGIIDVIDFKGKKINNLLKSENPLGNYKVSKPEIFTIKSADNTTDLYCRMIKPSNFNPDRKYPVLVYVYGGPHAQMVNNKWLAGAPLWMYYQAERDYIIFTVDNRGSANRGFEFESVIHRKLGDNEIEDQMKGVEYLKSLPYVNQNRMAVHGWSFGGFMTTSLMLRKPGVFTTGVAGGPVTDWKYYEIMYGERYMDKPQQNEEGYEKSRLHNYVKNLKGKLLLIHGTVDDVVVMQHNLSLVKSFIDEGIQMDFFPYPMHPHNVRGKDRVHLMTKVLNYIEENNRNKKPVGNRRKGGVKRPALKPSIKNSLNKDLNRGTPPPNELKKVKPETIQDRKN